MFAGKLIRSLIPSKGSPSGILPSIQSVRLLSETVSSSEAKPLIAVVQLNCKQDKEANFRMSERLLRQAAYHKCSMAFLPENFDAINLTRKDVAAALEPIDGPLISRYRDLARSLNIWLSLGGFHEKPANNDEGKKYNTHLIISNEGEIVSIYRKLHLYDVHHPGEHHIIESKVTIAGDKIVPPVETPIGKVGVGICYDIRFPEFGIALAKAGADILTYPSEYTLSNGPLWESLTRARAIENNCYVIGACQTGYASEQKLSYGHSIVVDPRGTVIAQVGDEVGLGLAVIDPVVLKKARIALPDFHDRRTDIYGEIITPQVK